MTTKQYLRFIPDSTFGLVASSNANIVHVRYGKKFNFVAVPACENVIIWNLQTKEKSVVMKGGKSYISCLMCDVNYRIIAVGYGDGMIHLFDLRSGNCIISFSGHKSPVSCLVFDDDGLNLASGGKDSEIVVWNVTDQAGLFRLKGHKGPVTQCYFVKSRNILISSSKDTYIKLWDLDTQHCIQTIVGNRNEILDFVVLKDTRLIVGLNEEDLKIWDLFVSDDDYELIQKAKKSKLDVTEVENDVKYLDGMDLQENADEEKFKYYEAGKISIGGAAARHLAIDKTQRVLGCAASNKVLQLFKILNPDEARKSMRKRIKRECRESGKKYKDVTMESEAIPSATDEIQSLQRIETSGKIDSFSIILEGNIAKIAVLLKNNSICHYQLDITKTDCAAEICHSIVFPGHRGVIRSLNYSADNQTVLSVSDESVKIWKRFQEEQVCTHTLPCTFGLCSVLVPGINHCIVGTKSGALEIFDVNSQQLLEKLEAHAGSVNCLVESPKQSGVTSGSKDKCIKFWDFELLLDENYSQTKKRLSLSLKRTLQMQDEITCLRYSPDGKRIAVALLDFTVKVLFVDSLKLVFSLYGHALPVLCLDISYDGTLIATGSEDRSVRIWSMEFGSCNKFIKKAHDNSVTCLNFLPKTHMFFTGGADYAVKQWDADKFRKIITLKGHLNEISAMAVSPDGASVVTGSKDKSIRIWEKTNELLVLEEEQEKEREEVEYKVEDLPVAPGEINKDAALPGVKTKETIKSLDDLIDAINLYKDEVLKLEEHEAMCKKAGKEFPSPAPHPLLAAYSTTSPIRYMQKFINKIKSSELEGMLLYLPFNYVFDFLKILCEFVDRGWETEFCERCSSFLVRIHMGQMLLTQNFQPVLEKLMEKLFKQVYQTRDMVGLVKATCQLQQRAVDALEEVPVFTSVLDGLQQKKRKSKRKERAVVAFV